MAFGDGGPKKNSENFRILQSHNMLSERCLQKTIEASIYINAEIGKAKSPHNRILLAPRLKLVIKDGWSRSELLPSLHRRLREIRLPGHRLANLGQTE